MINVKKLLNIKKKKKKKFTYVSLFSGIGGFEKALDILGGECLLACEFDKYAQKTYQSLFPTHSLKGDVTKLEIADVPNHDVLVGGFPCQAFSKSGKQLAFEDDRGQLYLEVVRIARVKQPKILLLENVKGLVGLQEGKVLKTILKAFEAIGYHMMYQVLDAKKFGLAQQRERVVFIGVRQDLVTDKDKNSLKKDLYTFESYERKTLLDILEKDVDEKYFVSKDRMKDYKEGLNGKPNKDLIFVGGFGNLWLETDGPYYSRNFKQGNRVYDAKGLATTLTAQSMGGLGKRTTMYIVPDEWSKNGLNIRGLTVEECFLLQGFSSLDVEKARLNGVSNAQLYKQIGNSIAVNMVYAVMSNILKYFF